MSMGSVDMVEEIVPYSMLASWLAPGWGPGISRTRPSLFRSAPPRRSAGLAACGLYYSEAPKARRTVSRSQRQGTLSAHNHGFI
jgi:hypothetical protein